MSTLKIGIIGCGTIGKVILNSVILICECYQIPLENIYISTRQPSKLSKYEIEHGINLTNQNEQIASLCDVMFLCFPPMIDNNTVLELKSDLSKRISSQNQFPTLPLIISTVSDLTVKKFEALIKIQSIFLPTSFDYKQLYEVNNENLEIIVKQCTERKQQIIQGKNIFTNSPIELLVVEHLFKDIAQLNNIIAVYKMVFKQLGKLTQHEQKQSITVEQLVNENLFDPVPLNLDETQEFELDFNNAILKLIFSKVLNFEEQTEKQSFLLEKAKEQYYSIMTKFFSNGMFTFKEAIEKL